MTGVGPKVALAIVGSRPTADLQLAIMAQDQAVLVSIPGIGKKLAERIIFELKEKVSAAGIAASVGAAAGIGAAESEVVAALQALGYSLAEAREASRSPWPTRRSVGRSRIGQGGPAEPARTEPALPRRAIAWEERSRGVARTSRGRPIRCELAHHRARNRLGGRVGGIANSANVPGVQVWLGPCFDS